MKPNLNYKLSKGARIIVLAFASFFMVLSVFDRFEENEHFFYEGEFVNETEFNFIEIPDIIPRTSIQKFSKSVRIEFVAFFGFLATSSVSNICPKLERIWDNEIHILSFAPFLKNFIFAQAP